MCMGLYTDKILQREPFNLNHVELEEYNRLAKELDITLDDFLLGKVYKKECAENPNPYTEAEIEEGERELVQLYYHTFNNAKPTNNPEYDFTLCAPAAQLAQTHVWQNPYYRPSRPEGIKLTPMYYLHLRNLVNKLYYTALMYKIFIKSPKPMPKVKWHPCLIV